MGGHKVIPITINHTLLIRMYKIILQDWDTITSCTEYNIGMAVNVTISDSPASQTVSDIRQLLPIHHRGTLPFLWS